jgi:hypothetical protein
LTISNTFLLFCPLNELAERIKIRNKKIIEDGEFSNRRGGFALWQYTQIYRAKKSSDELTLEILKRCEAEDAFHQYISKDMEKGTLSMFLQKLSFTSPETEEVEITSRFKHYSDIIYSNTTSGKRF